jgi:hypothetical protein
MLCDLFWPEDPLPVPGTRVDAETREPVAPKTSAPVVRGSVRRPTYPTPIPVGRLNAMTALTQQLARKSCAGRVNGQRCGRQRPCAPCKARRILDRWPMNPSARRRA